MSAFHIIAILITLTALFSYLNHRFIKLPTAIGVMLMALVLSLVLIVLEKMGVDFRQGATRLLERIHFDQALMQGMLSFLLFAGALQINLSDLAEQRVAILLLAILGVLLSMLIFGT